jgi:hypothetical protein
LSIRGESPEPGDDSPNAQCLMPNA